MKLSALLAPLLDAKADHNLIRAQILAYEAEQGEALERRRKADADRQSRKRSRDVTLRHSDRSLTSEPARVEDKTSNLEIEPQKEESKKVTARGTRLPADFVPDIGWAISAGLPEHFAHLEAASFCDFWHAKPGTGGTKVDWAATWRVWVRTAMRRLPRGVGPPEIKQAKIDPTLAAAHRLQDKIDASTRPEIEGNHPPPRLVAIGGRGG